MNEALPPDLPGGVAAALGTLRHALADPLSAAGVKLELLDRRLAAAPAEVLSLADRVRGVKADLAAAGRLIDLLPRLAGIAAEPAGETSLGELCRVAGSPLEGDSAGRSRLRLRRVATTDALRSLVWFLRSRDPEGRSPRLHEDSASGQVALRIEGLGGSGEAHPDRLFRLPHGQERAEDLFLARASIESDGGRLQLVEREGRLVALLSWPGPADAGEGGPDL